MDSELGGVLKHRAFPEAKIARQTLLHEFIAIVEVMAEIDPPVGPNPSVQYSSNTGTGACSETVRVLPD
jgi:hypothetical protein